MRLGLSKAIQNRGCSSDLSQYLSQLLGQMTNALPKAMHCKGLRWVFMDQAERTGFEPAEGFDPFTDLANRRIRPLCHLSRDGNETAANLVGFAGHSF